MHYQVTAKLSRLVLDNPDALDLQRMVAAAQINALDSDKIQAQHIELLQRLAYDACFVRNEDSFAVMPQFAIVNLLREGAKRFDAGQESLSAVNVIGEVELLSRGQPVDVTTAWECLDQRLQVMGVNEVGTRTVPLLSDVTIRFELALDESRVSAVMVERWLSDALNLRGVGYLRPSFGRGRVVSMAPIEQAEQAVSA